MRSTNWPYIRITPFTVSDLESSRQLYGNPLCTLGVPFPTSGVRGVDYKTVFIEIFVMAIMHQSLR